MKKIIVILGIACISASSIAQSSSENDLRSKLRESRNKYLSSGFAGFGFIQNKTNYYDLSSSGINIDIGSMHRYQFRPRFALIGTVQYSYYNYKLRDAASEPTFNNVVLGGKTYDNINKQVFRTHNISASAGYRFYLVKPKRNDNNAGLFVDLSVQGDLAFSKYYKLKINGESNLKHRDKDVFNPLTTSYIARAGLGWFSIYARYRVTDAFNSKHLPIDIPPLTIGVQFL